MAWRGRFAALLLLVALFSSRAVEGGDAPQDPAAVEKQLAEKDTRIAELERELRVVGGAHAGGRSRGGASLRAEATLEERVKALEKTVSSVNVTSMDEQVAHLLRHVDPEYDSGSIAWLNTASTLVFMMTIPGLALFYGGLVRLQNVLSIVMQSFSIACLITVLWISFGYSLCFSPGSAVFGDWRKFWLLGVTMDTRHESMPNVPEPIFVMYELTFAIITPALISGSFADRMRLGPMLVFIGLWHILVYCPITHSMWGPGGFLLSAGILDFAGGNVVHIAAGISGLMSSIVVGKRTGYGKEGATFHPHNILLSVLGASLLWVGWIGFNGGSAGGSNKLSTVAILNTNVSAATASLSWMFTEWALRKRPSVLGIISGAIAGLVTITPGAGYVDTTGAFIFGLLAGPVCYFAAQLKHWFGFDDALDAFGIHAPAGVLGGVLTGFFATETVTGEGSGIRGIFYGDDGMQLVRQLYGIGVSIAWSSVVTLILLKGVDATMGLRVAVEDELIGLDMAVHGTTMAPSWWDSEAAKMLDTSHKSRMSGRGSMELMSSRDGTEDRRASSAVGGGVGGMYSTSFTDRQAPGPTQLRHSLEMGQSQQPRMVSFDQENRERFYEAAPAPHAMQLPMQFVQQVPMLPAGQTLQYAPASSQGYAHYAPIQAPPRMGGTA